MAKKNFDIVNPAMQFITQEEEPKAPADNMSELAAGFKGMKRGRKPSTEETKTKRLNLLMLPSVCEDIGKLATMERVSTNELINSILKDYIEQNQEKLKKYEEVFGDK